MYLYIKWNNNKLQKKKRKENKIKLPEKKKRSRYINFRKISLSLINKQGNYRVRDFSICVCMYACMLYMYACMYVCMYIYIHTYISYDILNFLYKFLIHSLIYRTVSCSQFFCYELYNWYKKIIYFFFTILYLSMFLSKEIFIKQTHHHE